MSSAMTIKQCKSSMLYCHYYTFLFELLKEKNFTWSTETFWKHYIYLLSKIAQNVYNTRPLFALSSLLLFKSLNLSAATEKLRTNYPVFFKPTCSLLNQEKRSQCKFLKSTLTISDKYWNSVSLFYCNTYTRGVFRTIRTSTIMLFFGCFKRSFTINVRLGSKYASAYIYIQVSPTESICIFCILNIFAVKYIFSYKRRVKF